MKKELLEGLNEEQINKLNKCKSNEEILELAKQEGIELTNEQLEAVNGGFCDPDGNSNFPNKCPNCGSTNTQFLGEYDVGKFVWEEHKCLNCNKEYRIKKSGY